jgi:hypothetical protein
MKEKKEQEEKAGEYGVISGERWEIYMFRHPTPTRLLLEQLNYDDALLLVNRLPGLWVFE